MAKSRRLLDFPMASPRTQYAQGMVKGLPYLERRRSRQTDQQRYEDAQRRRQEDIDRQLAQMDEKKLQGAADAVMDFLTTKGVTPEARERILGQVPDQIKSRMPFMPEGELYEPKDPLLEQAKRRKAEDVLEELAPTQEREKERLATEKKEQKAQYKVKTDRAKEISQDDILTSEGRVAAIKGLGLRSGDEAFHISRAKIAKRPPVYKPAKLRSREQLGSYIGGLRADIEWLEERIGKLEGGTSWWTGEPKKPKEHKRITALHQQKARALKQLDKAQAEFTSLGPPAPPLTPQTAPSAQSNEQTPDNEKLWQEFLSNLDDVDKRRAQRYLDKGITKEEIMRRAGY